MADLVRLTHGLYCPAGAVESLSDRCAALLGVFPEGAAIGGVAAARLHELWLPSADPAERIDIVLRRPGRRPHEFAGSRRRDLHVRRRSVSDDEIVSLAGVPVSSLARTWVDLAELLGLEDVVAAGDCALRAGASLDELAEQTRRAAGRRGVVRARTALALLDRRSRSRPESHLRCAVVLGGLPKPEVNESIHNAFGEWLAEPDLHFKQARLALEYNGSDHADPRQMRKDITRAIDVDQGGWKTVVFGPAQVYGRKWEIAPYVRTLLDERDPGWRGRAA